MGNVGQAAAGPGSKRLWASSWQSPPGTPRQERGSAPSRWFSTLFIARGGNQQSSPAGLPGWAPSRPMAGSPQRIHTLSPRRSQTPGAPSFPRNFHQLRLESSDRELPSPAARWGAGVGGRERVAGFHPALPPRRGSCLLHLRPACKFQRTPVSSLPKSRQNHPNPTPLSTGKRTGRWPLSWA